MVYKIIFECCRWKAKLSLIIILHERNISWVWEPLKLRWQLKICESTKIYFEFLYSVLHNHWSGFFSSDSTPGVLVSTLEGQLAKSPNSRAPPKKVPPQLSPEPCRGLKKLRYRRVWEMDQQPNWPLLWGTTPGHPHGGVTNGPLTDWSVLCQPSVTPVSVM